jgi:hypothetical protein
MKWFDKHKDTKRRFKSIDYSDWLLYDLYSVLWGAKEHRFELSLDRIAEVIVDSLGAEESRTLAQKILEYEQDAASEKHS